MDHRTGVHRVVLLAALHLLMFAWMMLSPRSAGAITIRIPATYPTVQEGLDHASPGDTVLVSPGVYQERLQQPSGVVLLSEEGPEVTILQGDGHSAGVDLRDAADSTLVGGFSIQDYIDGVLVVGGEPVIEGNNLYRNSTAGVNVTLSSDPLLTGNLITGSANGILCDAGSSPRIWGNTLILNKTGILLTVNTAPLVEKNIIVLNDLYGVYGWLSSPVFGCNDVWGNGSGFGGDVVDPTGGDGNISVDPLLCSAYEGRFGLREGSPCAPGADSCDGRGARGVECEARVWVVDPLGGGDVESIQEAVNAALPPDTVEVCEGTYTESLSLSSPLVIRSREGPEFTVVDAEGAVHALQVAGVDSSALLCGLALRGASAEALLVEAGSSPRLEDLLVSGSGAGVRIVSSNPRLSRVTITACEGDGVILEGSADATIDHSVIVGNLGAGITVLTSGTAELSCSDVFANSEGNYVGLADQTGDSGNISADPLFCDAQGGDYSLRSGSPCLPEGKACGMRGALPLGCVARLWYVDALGSGDAPTIQAGVDSCVPGDTVRVAPGEYTESIDLSSGVILEGELSAESTLLFPAAGPGISCSECVGPTLIRNLTVEGSSESGIRLQESSGFSVSGCTLLGNVTGIEATGGWLDLDSLLFTQNVTGLRAEACSVEAFGNTWYFQAGSSIEVGDSATARIERSIVSASGGAGISVNPGAAVTLNCNDFWGNLGGDYIGTAPGDGDFSADPLFCSPAEGDFTLDIDSPCTPAGSEGCGLVGARDVGCGLGVAVEDGEPGKGPSCLSLRAVPNPLPHSGEIIAYIPEPGGEVTFSLFDVRGRRLWRTTPRILPSGEYTHTYAADEWSRLAPGIYFLRVTGGTESATIRLVISP